MWTKEVETSPDEQKYDRMVGENSEKEDESRSPHTHAHYRAAQKALEWYKKEEVLPGEENGTVCRESDDKIQVERHCVNACFAEDTQSKEEDRGVKTTMNRAAGQSLELDNLLLSLYGKYQDKEVVPNNMKREVEVEKMRNNVGVNMVEINNKTDKTSVEFEKKTVARAREVKQRGRGTDQQENLRRTGDNEVKTVEEDGILPNQICKKSRLKKYMRCKKDADNHKKKEITDFTPAEFQCGMTHSE